MSSSSLSIALLDLVVDYLRSSCSCAELRAFIVQRLFEPATVTSAVDTLRVHPLLQHEAYLLGKWTLQAIHCRGDISPAVHAVYGEHLLLSYTPPSPLALADAGLPCSVPSDSSAANETLRRRQLIHLFDRMATIMRLSPNCAARYLFQRNPHDLHMWIGSLRHVNNAFYRLELRKWWLRSTNRAARSSFLRYATQKRKLERTVHQDDMSPTTGARISLSRIDTIKPELGAMAAGDAVWAASNVPQSKCTEFEFKLSTYQPVSGYRWSSHLNSRLNFVSNVRCRGGKLRGDVWNWNENEERSARLIVHYEHVLTFTPAATPIVFCVASDRPHDLIISFLNAQLSDCDLLLLFHQALHVLGEKLAALRRC